MDYLTQTFFLIPNWKWLALALLICIFFIGQKILKTLISGVKSRDRIRLVHPLIKHVTRLPIESPIAWIIMAGLTAQGFESLDLGVKTTLNIKLLFHLIFIFNSFRLCYLFVDAIGIWMSEAVKHTENTLDDQLVPFATKILKTLVLVLGVLLTLQSFSINVMSLLAGLGLGGLALALAAQDTAANLFGSVTIIMDRPFKVGDYIKMGSMEGTVEEIGFRSTRLRTPTKSILAIPNSAMAKDSIENLGVRPARRFRHILGLTYETPPDKIKSFRDGVEKILTSNDLISKDDIVVRLNSLGDFSLGLLVQCFFLTTDGDVELKMQEDILHAILNLAQQMQIDFAYPTQTHYLKN